MSKQKRINFSIVSSDGGHFIQCDETQEFVSGKIKSKREAKTMLLEHARTQLFKETCKNFSKKEVLRRMKIFGGRLRPRKKPWTIEEAMLVASVYETRGELYKQNQNAYLCGYQKGWLNQMCAHMKPSRKRNKFVFGVLNPNAALAKLFDYTSHYDFTRDNQSAYDALRRYGVDTIELFENKDNADYLKLVIKKLAQDSVEKMV